MGEKQNGPFQLSFNTSLKVDFQGSRVTSDGGLILVRELDERLGFSPDVSHGERIGTPSATQQRHDGVHAESAARRGGQDLSFRRKEARTDSFWSVAR
jgi:hypothetical protein